MANFVVKKDGAKEPFDAEKIKNAIAAAAQKTDISEERKNEVVEQVSAAVIQIAEAKEEIATSEIRENIISQLNSIEPAVAASWLNYEEENKGV
jgi:transcriptional regulator NrdR family protein